MKLCNLSCKAKHVLGTIILLVPTVVSFCFGINRMGLEHTLVSFGFTLVLVLTFFYGWFLITSRNK